MSRPMRTTVVLVILAVGVVSPGAVTASQAPANEAALNDCRERFVIAPGDDQAVRARVPAKYELARDGAGNPLLYVGAIRCERYTAEGTTAPTTAAAFAAMIKSPDGVGCTSQWPVVGGVKGDALSCNLYVLFAAYDNPAVVRWLRAGTPDLPVHYVEDLRFDERDLDAAGLSTGLAFHAGRPSPSPFEMDAVVRARPVETPLTATFWAETKSGTVRIRFQSGDLAQGHAEGALRVARGTEMARLLGTTSATGAAPFTLIAGNRWRSASLTKNVVLAT